MMYTVYQVMPQRPSSAINLTVSSFRKLSSDVLEVVLKNPDTHYLGQLISLKYAIINYTRRNLNQINGYDSVGEFIGVEDNSYV